MTRTTRLSFYTTPEARAAARNGEGFEQFRQVLRSCRELRHLVPSPEPLPVSGNGMSRGRKIQKVEDWLIRAGIVLKGIAQESEGDDLSPLTEAWPDIVQTLRELKKEAA